jgi:hypothetical protein
MYMRPVVVDSSAFQSRPPGVVAGEAAGVRCCFFFCFEDEEDEDEEEVTEGF